MFCVIGAGGGTCKFFFLSRFPVCSDVTSLAKSGRLTYRTPRRFATDYALDGAPAFGVRQFGLALWPRGVHSFGAHLVISPLIQELLPAMMPKPWPGQARCETACSAFPSHNPGPFTSVPYVTRSLHACSWGGGVITKSLVSPVASRWGCVGMAWLNACQPAGQLVSTIR
jgi:hypothetical protein